MTKKICFLCPILTISLKLNTNRHIAYSLLCIALLVNISIKLDHVWGSSGGKTSQKQTKMIFSAGWKTLEYWKLGKHKSGISETWTIYVPSQYFSFAIKRGYQWVNEGVAHTKKYQKMSHNSQNLGFNIT